MFTNLQAYIPDKSRCFKTFFSHSAEVPFPKLTMPVLRSVQSLLRSKGKGLFDILAKPDIVKQILMEPYAISDNVDEELVDVLLTPLLTPGASDVVFDTLSYSAGPLPEQQLGEKNHSWRRLCTKLQMENIKFDLLVTQFGVRCPEEAESDPMSL